MKKAVLALILSSSFYCAVAQLAWGIKTGVNLSESSTNGEIYSNYLTSYNIGLMAEKKIRHRFSMVTELLYSREGNSLVLEIGEFHTNYISMPVLAGFSLARKWQIMLGPELSYLVRAFVQEPNYYLNAIQFYRRFEEGVAGGVRYKLTGRWGFEIRYIYGISGIEKPSYSSNGTYAIVPPQDNPKNMVFQSDIFFAIK